MRIVRGTKGDWGNVKLIFTVSVENDSIIIDGFKLVEKFDGSFFIGVPSRQNKEGEWNNIVRLEKEKGEELLKLTLKYYEEN